MSVFDDDRADCWIRTDLAGYITQLDPTCPEILNITNRGARNRSLLTFLDGDRGRVTDHLIAASREYPSSEIVVTLRPRERRPHRVKLNIVKVDSETLEWRLRRDEPSAVER